MLLNCAVREDDVRRPNLSILKEITGRTDAEAETPLLWPPDVKNWCTGKDPDAGKDWRQEEKGRTEDDLVGWDHQLDGHECEQAPGVGDGQGGLACCSPWGHKELDMTEWLNWTELIPLAAWPINYWENCFKMSYCDGGFINFSL